MRAERVLGHELNGDLVGRAAARRRARHRSARVRAVSNLGSSGRAPAFRARDRRPPCRPASWTEHIFAGRHRHRARDEAGDAGDEHFAGRGRGGGDADDEARRRDDAVIGAENGRRAASRCARRDEFPCDDEPLSEPLPGKRRARPREACEAAARSGLRFARGRLCEKAVTGLFRVQGIEKGRKPHRRSAHGGHSGKR